MDSDAFVTVDGDRIHYLAAGDGPPVVLLHGGIIDAADVTWPPVADRLAPDHTVVVPDLLGYGESDLPPGPYSVQRHADVVAGVLDELALAPVTLVGHSLGGGVATQVAFDRPDAVTGLVPVDAYGLGADLPNGRLSYLLARLQILNKLAVALFRRSRRLTRASLGGIVHDLEALPAAAVDAVFEEVQRPKAGAAFRRFRAAEVTREGYRTTFRDRFEDVSVPTHLVHGADDQLFPVSWAERAADRVPGATLTVLDECGHWAPRERPDRVAELTRTVVQG
jgi:pimeloyl-ACP methyl ester carboxylesterase